MIQVDKSIIYGEIQVNDKNLLLYPIRFRDEESIISVLKKNKTYDSMAYIKSLVKYSCHYENNTNNKERPIEPTLSEDDLSSFTNEILDKIALVYLENEFKDESNKQKNELEDRDNINKLAYFCNERYKNLADIGKDYASELQKNIQAYNNVIKNISPFTGIRIPESVKTKITYLNLALGKTDWDRIYKNAHTMLSRSLPIQNQFNNLVKNINPVQKQGVTLGFSNDLSKLIRNYNANNNLFKDFRSVSSLTSDTSSLLKTMTAPNNQLTNHIKDQTKKQNDIIINGSTNQIIRNFNEPIIDLNKSSELLITELQGFGIILNKGISKFEDSIKDTRFNTRIIIGLAIITLIANIVVTITSSNGTTNAIKDNTKEVTKYLKPLNSNFNNIIIGVESLKTEILILKSKVKEQQKEIHRLKKTTQPNTRQ